MSYRAGELDQLITIQRQVLTPDGMGGQTVTLTDVVTDLWARVRPMSGGEAERFDKLNATATATFIVRYRDDLKHDDRIVWRDQEWNIRHIPPVSSREMYLAIQAETGVAQ